MRRKYQICDGAGDDDVGDDVVGSGDDGGGDDDVGSGDDDVGYGDDGGGDDDVGDGDDGGGDDDVGSNGSGSLLRGNINTQLAKQLRNRLLPCAGVISPFWK